MTYDAFAARLVAEHGLRIGVETDPTLISGATRYRLASRVVAAAAGPFEYISRLRPATITERVLRLDARSADHLIDPSAAGRRTPGSHCWVGRRRRRTTAGNVYADIKRAILATSERLELASLVRGLPAAQGAARRGRVRRPDGDRRPAGAERVPEVSVALRNAYQVVLLDEYQDTSAAQAMMLRRVVQRVHAESGDGASGHRCRRPVPGDLRLARGAASSNILQFAREFPRAERGAVGPVRADRQPAQRGHHPRRGESAECAAATGGAGRRRRASGFSNRRPGPGRRSSGGPPSRPGRRRSAGSRTRWWPRRNRAPPSTGPTSPS